MHFWRRTAVADLLAAIIVTFRGRAGGELIGVVDLMAVRKDHSKPLGVLKRGDALQAILIQVKR